MVKRKSFADNKEMLYNNTESESGINGDIERYIDERRNRVYEEQKNSQNREYSNGRNTNGIQEGTMGSQEESSFSIDRYKQEEKSIR